MVAVEDYEENCQSCSPGLAWDKSHVAVVEVVLGYIPYLFELGVVLFAFAVFVLLLVVSAFVMHLAFEYILCSYKHVVRAYALVAFVLLPVAFAIAMHRHLVVEHIPCSFELVERVYTSVVLVLLKVEDSHIDQLVAVEPAPS